MKAINLEYGKTAFHADASRQDKAVILGWITETQFKNVYRYILIVLRWGLPLVSICRADVADD